MGSTDNYWGAKSVFESDEFADLDLRTTLGPYLGRLFYEKKHFTLQAEVGPVYVNEQFKEAGTENWSGLSWIIKAESDRLGYGSTLYLNHDGNQNLQASDNLILNTQIGLSFPLVYGFETFFQLNLNTTVEPSRESKTSTPLTTGISAIPVGKGLNTNRNGMTVAVELL